MKLSECSDEELGAIVRSRFERLAQAHADGLTDTHPGAQWNMDSATLRGLKANDQGGLGPVQIQNKTKRGEDDVQPQESATPVKGQGAGKTPAQDSASLARVGAMASAIKDYGRLAIRK